MHKLWETVSSQNQILYEGREKLVTRDRFRKHVCLCQKRKRNSLSKEINLPTSHGRLSGYGSQPILVWPPWNPWAQHGPRLPRRQWRHHRQQKKNRRLLMQPHDGSWGPLMRKETLLTSSSIASTYSWEPCNPLCPTENKARKIRKGKLTFSCFACWF